MFKFRSNVVTPKPAATPAPLITLPGQLLDASFESNKKLLKTDTHWTSQSVSNWEHNRVEDSGRVDELKNHIALKGAVPNVVYVFTTDDVTFLCYDGAHRLLAAKKLLSETGRSLPVLVSVFKVEASRAQQVIQEEFQNLNKRVAVPEFLLQEAYDARMGSAAHEYVSRLQKEFGGRPGTNSIFSNSDNCKIPHVNGDRLKEAIFTGLSELMVGHNKVLEDVEELVNLMEQITPQVNSEIFNSISHPNEKATRLNCYLFAAGKDSHDSLSTFIKVFMTHIERAMT